MDTLKERLRARLPSKQEVGPVFSTIVFIVFTWTLYRMFYQVPSWLYYMSVWSVLVIAAYVLAFALFESIVILGLMLFFSLVFPARHFKDKFVPQGFTIAVVMGGGAYLLQRKINVIYKLNGWELIIYPIIVLIVALILILTFSFVFDHFRTIKRLVNAVAERLTVFSYIYVPLSLVSLVVVLVRNIF